MPQRKKRDNPSAPAARPKQKAGAAKKPARKATGDKGTPKVIRVGPEPGAVVTKENLEAAKIVRDFMVDMCRLRTGREIIVKLPGEQ